MANRMLRDTTDSEKINRLSESAEILFYRLMMKADDYGNYHANVKLIKANCYPFKADIISDEKILTWLTELVNVKVIDLYTVDGKTFLNILNFGQRLRTKKKRFPAYLPSNGGNMPQVAAECPSELETEIEIEIEEEEETEIETEGKKNGFLKNEKFLIPKMLQEWKKFFKNYPEKKEKDFPALRQIAEFIAEKQKIDCDVGIIPAFKQLIEYISGHDFYRKYSLLQVSRNIQSIVISITDEQQSTSKKGGKPNSADFHQQINASFAKRYPTAPA